MFFAVAFFGEFVSAKLEVLFTLYQNKEWSMGHLIDKKNPKHQVLIALFALSTCVIVYICSGTYVQKYVYCIVE